MAKRRSAPPTETTTDPLAETWTPTQDECLVVDDEQAADRISSRMLVQSTKGLILDAVTASLGRIFSDLPKDAVAELGFAVVVDRDDDLKREFIEAAQIFRRRFLTVAAFRTLRECVQSIYVGSGLPYTRSIDAALRKELTSSLSRVGLREPFTLEPRGATTATLTPLTEQQLAVLAPKCDEIEGALDGLPQLANRTSIDKALSYYSQMLIEFCENERAIIGEVCRSFAAASWMEGGERVGVARISQECARRILGIGDRSARSLEADVSRSRSIRTEEN